MRTPRYRFISLAFAALLALVAAGCGGGGNDSTESTASTTTEATTLSKSELISQGDAICAEVNAAVGSVGASESGVPSEVTQVAGLYTGMVESIKRLGTPEDPAGYSDFMAAAEELAKVEGEAKLAAEREDTEALGEAATKAAPALEEFESQAAIYGFEDCSEGPHAPTTTVPSGAEEGGVEAAPEAIEEPEIEEVAPEEAAPETGGAGGGVEEGGGTGGGTGGGGGETGGGSGGVGPG
jgi:hypothetical protein